MGQPLRVGMVGAGTISAQYLATLDQLESVALVAVADLNHELAAAVAQPRPAVRACTVAELVAADDIDLVLNLTIPLAHAEIALAAIGAGKHVYGEKPLAMTTAQGQQILAAAAAAGVLVGCAPDTVLGSGIQTARRAVDDGLVGRPIAATATMVVPGHERWHPNPDFYYQPGGGPLLDMGPYYLTALITLLGPVTSVMGASSRTRQARIIGSGPRLGQVIPVDVDTHVTGILTHASGVLSTVVMSFDAVGTRSANIEIHGEQGTLVVPDPNRFDGDVLIRVLGATEDTLLPVSAGYVGAGRGVGVADLAATPTGESPRASGELAQHVLDVMLTLLESATTHDAQAVLSTVARPEPVALQSPGRVASVG